MFFGLFGAVSSFASFPSEPAQVPCAHLYQARENLATAHSALTCLREAMRVSRDSDVGLFREAAEKAAETAFWIYTQTGGSNRKLAITSGAEVAEAAIQAIPAAGVGPYWSALFQMLACREVDRRIPYCLLRHRKKIDALLKQARDCDPNLHGNGPSRALSVLYRELPRIGGGNFEHARSFSQEALDESPNFSTNAIEGAKLEIKTRNLSAARKLLEDFLVNACHAMDPNRIPECEADRKEASRILRELNSIR